MQVARGSRHPSGSSASLENSKSLRSPEHDHARLRVRGEDVLRRSRAPAAACCVALRLGARGPAAGSGRTAGRRRPWSSSGWRPRTARSPSYVNSPASGLRLLLKAASVGLDPTGADRQAAGRPARRPRRPGWSASPPGAVHERQAAIGAEQEADADVAARLAAVLVVDRVDLAVVVGRATGRLDRRRSAWLHVCAALTVPSLVGPLLSWTSSTEIRSGERRLSTITSASAANFAGGSPGSRFSTLNVATRSARPRRRRPPSRARVRRRRRPGSVATSSLKLPNE